MLGVAGDKFRPVFGTGEHDFVKHLVFFICKYNSGFRRLRFLAQLTDFI